MASCKTLSLLALSLVAAIILQIAYQAGEMTPLELSDHDAHCSHVSGYAGLEDVEVSTTLGGRVIVSADPHRSLFLVNGLLDSDSEQTKIARMTKEQQGALGLFDPAHPEKGVQPFPTTGIPHQDFHPHGISVFEADGALRVFVVNHMRTGDGVVVLDYDKASHSLRWHATYTAGDLVHLNGIFPVSADAYFVTRFHHYAPGTPMHILETFGQQPWTSVLFCHRDNCTTVADKLRMANGVLATRDTLYVADTVSKNVHVFDIQYQPNDNANDPTQAPLLSNRRLVPLSHGPDNIKQDTDGFLWITGHPRLLTFVRYSKDPAKRTSPFTVTKMHPTTFETKDVLVSNGQRFSGASTAVKLGKNLLIGGVYHDGAYLCPEDV